jgi:hypothetical protein
MDAFSLFQKIGSLHLNPQVKNTCLLCSQVSLEHKACPNPTQCLFVFLALQPIMVVFSTAR